MVGFDPYLGIRVQIDIQEIIKVSTPATGYDVDSPSLKLRSDLVIVPGKDHIDIILLEKGYQVFLYGYIGFVFATCKRRAMEEHHLPLDILKSRGLHFIQQPSMLVTPG